MVRKDATEGAARMIAEFERIELESFQRGKTGPLKVLSDWSATQWILASTILAYCKDTFDKVQALLLRSTSTSILRLDAVYNRITTQEFLCSWYGTRWILELVFTSCNGASEIDLTSISKSTSNGLLILKKLHNRTTTGKVLHDCFRTRNSLKPVLAYCSGAWQTILEQISILLDILKKGFAAVPGPVVWGSMGLVITGIFITEFERNGAAREQALRERTERERAEREQATRQEMQGFVAWIAVLSVLAIIGAGICFYKISVYNNNEARNEQVQTFNYTLKRCADRVVRAIGSHEEAVDRMSGAIKSHGSAIYNVGQAIEDHGSNVSLAIAYHGKAVDNVGREVRYLGAAANRSTDETIESRSERQKLLEAPSVESRAAK